MEIIEGTGILKKSSRAEPSFPRWVLSKMKRQSLFSKSQILQRGIRELLWVQRDRNRTAGNQKRDRSNGFTRFRSCFCPCAKIWVWNTIHWSGFQRNLWVWDGSVPANFLRVILFLPVDPPFQWSLFDRWHHDRPVDLDEGNLHIVWLAAGCHYNPSRVSSMGHERSAHCEPGPIHANYAPAIFPENIRGLSPIQNKESFIRFLGAGIFSCPR